MKRSQTSKTGRRDFLKLLGLGGLGTAAGLSVGAKVLGGKVVASELPEGAKMLSGGLDQIPTYWSKVRIKEEIQEAPAKILKEVASRPSTFNGKHVRNEWLPNELCVEFITRDGVVASLNLQGSVTTTLEREVSELYNRGELVQLVPGCDYISFEVEGSVNYFSGKIEPRQFSTLLIFDMRITADGETRLLRDCTWTDIEQDLAFGLFYLRGVAKIGWVIRET